MPAPKIAVFIGWRRNAESENYLEKRRKLLKVLRPSFLSLVTALLLVACNPAAVPQPTATATEAPRTSTATPTELPLSIETSEPRVEPVAIDELLMDPGIYQEWHLPKTIGGGYFSGEVNLDDPERYLYLDYSYQNEVRIVENATLDQNSWGLFIFREKNYDGQVFPQYSLTHFLLQQRFVYNKDLKIIWGELEVGTKFFVADDVSQYTRINGFPKDISEADIRKYVLPIEDERFTCTKVVDRFAGSSTPGTLCEYTG